jgi:hypothetical protein
MLSFSIFAQGTQECGTESTRLDHSDKLSVMTDELGNHRIWNEQDRHKLTFCISDDFREHKEMMVEAMQIAVRDWSG